MSNSTSSQSQDNNNNNDTDNDVTPSIGFITSQITKLPIAIRVIITLVCIVIGVALCTISPYAARWGTQCGLGRSTASLHADGNGGEKKRFRLAGGVLGIFTGGLGATYIIVLVSVAILNTQDNPSLSPWALVVISFIAGITGGILGGRWKAISRLLLTLTGSISLTLLFSTSFKIDHQLGRLIIFLILYITSLITSFIFSLIPSRSSLQTLSNRISFLLTSSTGAWLIFGIGLDIFVKCGLLDGFGLLVSSGGVFDGGRTETMDNNDENNGIEVRNVVRWDEGRCKGLLAAMWLAIIAGTAFQLWRYSIIGDDLDESWNTYLGSLLSNEKTLITQSRNTTGSKTLSNRAGFFTARQGWFKRLFMSNSKQRKRLLPATYMLPEEQSEHSPHALPTERMGFNGAVGPHDDFEAREDMREVHNPGGAVRVDGRRTAPAKYDSLGYSTVGLGLYDGMKDQIPDESDLYGYDGQRTSSHAQVPMYSPGIYAHNQNQRSPQIQRSESEPSFNAVPQYTPHANPRVQNPSVLSGDTMVDSIGGEGVYTLRRIVEESTEEEDYGEREREREAFIAPLSPQARRGVEAQSVWRGPSSERRQQGTAAEQEQGGNHIPIPATPSLVNAIRRVSEAQAQARAWRIKESQAALSPSYRSENNIATSSTSASPGPSAMPGTATGTPRIPDSERIALRQAAIRRQASAEWWNEVERRANEQALKERSVSGSRTEIGAGSAAFSPRVSSAPDERSMPWRSNSRGPSKYPN